ncbi:MAG: cyclic nucleotide-binding domain-containing protein [Chloroflexota bacterium]|nr:cyclic nucleotide-binding domain-containing protein [Chloroflexota bacterium]
MTTEILSQLYFFDDLTPSQLSIIDPLFSLCICKKNEAVFIQGDEADYLYIVIDGSVDIRYKPHDGETITVAHIEKEGVFGWSAAFGNGDYTSGAVCMADTKLLCVHGNTMKEFHKKHPKTSILVLNRLAKVIVKRLKRSHTHAQVVAMLEHGLNNGVKPIGEQP